MPTGTLEVIVVEGRHLKDRDLVGENDTYVEIYLDKKYKQRITTISNSNNTVWNQCFTFNLQKGDDTIHFDIYDADVIGRDSIGNCIDDECLQETNVFDSLWFTITNDGLKSITKYSEYIIKNVMKEQLKSQSILFRALSEYHRENVFLSLKESKIVDNGNSYKLTLDDVTEHGWLTDVQSIKDDVTPRSHNMLLEKLHSFHKKAESSQQEESKPIQGAQRTEFVRPELTSTKNNNTNENDEPKSDQSDDSDDEASISSDIRKQIPILNDSQIKVQMATARIRKTKQLVEGSQPLARSKQIPREEKNSVPQAVATSENSIFITGLPKTMSEDLLFRTLRDEFSTVGKIEIDKTTKNPSIYLFKEKDKPSELNGRGKITFQKEESAKKAIEIYNGKRIKSLNNSQIYVKNFQAKTPKVLPPTPEPKPPISLMQIPQASGKHLEKKTV
ncbi:unnamed protein product [Rotaria sordida]|uniref:C2 domain-containing protein n=2 Tax=Rotaria sordida TaxID=392033 RepID=A0A814LJS3_9BILA|nr:unnamed protein product [Rotaria sordida]